jgi:hypothetical protein
MSLSKLAAIMALAAACFVPSGETRSTGDGLKSPVAEFAGDYYFGDGLGVNCSLTITQGGRFSFGWRGCLGIYDQNSGEAKVEAGHLILKPESPNVREGFRGTATDLIPVRWGERLYLVTEAERWEFCNQVNQGGEPRDGPHGRFYLRQGDWAKKVTGPPSVPKGWEPLLLKKPLHGRVIEVLHGDRAKVDLGADSGVWKGMELWADTEGFGLVQVVEVGAESSIISTKYTDMTPIRFQKGQGVRSKLADEQ